MEDQLYPRPTSPSKPRARRLLSTREFRAADITLLKVRNFLQEAKHKDVVIGYTSLYEID